MAATAVAVLSTLLASGGLVPTSAASAATVTTASRSMPCRSIIHRAFYKDYDEEQPAGIAASANWHFGAELDLRVTSDGKVVLVHDNSLTRITGGLDTRAAEDLTYAEVSSIPLKRGGRVIGVWKALRTAHDANAKLVLEIKRYWDFKDRWDTQGFPYLVRAIWKTGMADRVFVGGSGPAFRTFAPRLLSYHRTRPGDVIDVAQLASTVTLVQLDPTHFDAQLVSDLRAAGARVATRLLHNTDAVQQAYKVGLRTMMSNKGWLVRKGCLLAMG